MRKVGVADYVVTVLVPELAVMLIKEDMKCMMRQRDKFYRRVRTLGRRYMKM